MQEYYFLFALAFVWTLFATIQDIKQREVSNWLNFSLIAFALAFRAFFAIQNKNADFFLLGVSGFAIFFALGNIFYYSKTFAGGDAKLLMGFGTILPYQNYNSLITLSLTFTLILFSIGAIYSLAYSLFILIKNKKEFIKEFKKTYSKNKNLVTLSLLSFLLSLVVSVNYPLVLLVTLASAIPLVYVYAHSLDKCMIRLVPPKNLREGDWLEKEISLGKTKIKKSVHGLSKKEIELLKKHNKPALIKEGIPFVPAFLLALIVLAISFVKFPHLIFLKI